MEFRYQNVIWSEWSKSFVDRRQLFWIENKLAKVISINNIIPGLTTDNFNQVKFQPKRNQHSKLRPPISATYIDRDRDLSTNCEINLISVLHHH